MALALNQANLLLVNNMRMAAQRASIDLDILKFFADFEYARSRLTACAVSGRPELAALAARAREALLAPSERAAARAAQPTARPQPATPAVPATAAQRVTAARELMNKLAVEASGLRSYFFVLKLEKCSGRDDLVALMPTFHKLLVKGTGEITAATMTRQVQALLG